MNPEASVPYSQKPIICPALNQIHSIHIFKPYFSKIICNIIPESAL
jgi:hypothetical protein